MIEKINLKNNKGISLASVIVTLVLAMIILSSIIYSNNRTKEIQKAMLLNSDIEELTKKVEVYYLEKGTLPILEEAIDYRYIKEGGMPDDPDTPVYYKLEISALENITLNNKEIKTEPPQDGEQWYVINKETHTIYFVKRIDGKVEPQIAQYSNKYESIILGATEDGDNRIRYNYNDSTGAEIVGDSIKINPGVDELLQDTTSLNVGNVYPERGEEQTGNNYAGEYYKAEGATGLYKSPYTYVGYTDANTGANDNSIVLHYDGIYNDGYGTSLCHKTSPIKWSDLSGNGNHGEIVDEFSWTWTYESTDYSTRDITKFRKSKIRGKGDSIFGDNSLLLLNKDYVLCDFYEDDINSNTIKKKDSANNIPDGSDAYTIEIAFESDGSEALGGLFGMGSYNNITYNENTEYYLNIFKMQTYYRNVDRNKTSSVFTVYEPKLLDPWIAGLKGRTSTIEDAFYNTPKSPYSELTRDSSSRTSWCENSLGTKISEETARNLLLEGKKNFVDNVANLFNLSEKKSNAIRINDKGNGFDLYYGNDSSNVINTKEGILSEGKHTVTVVFDGQNTNIYLDGICVETNGENKKPNTDLREITVGATNMSTTVDYRDNLHDGNVKVIVYGSEKWTYKNSLSKPEKTFTTAKVDLYSTNEGEKDLVYLDFKYNEFFSGNIYAVRVYNRALVENETKKEISHNYNIDKLRFDF